MPENLPRLYYQSDDEVNRLPEWAYFFITLGQKVATHSSPDHRLVIALSIPTRAFACGLLAVGIALSGAANDRMMLQSQVRFVRNLPIGTQVYVRKDNNRKLRGIVQRFDRYEGADHIFIQLSGREVRGFSLDRYASRITVAEKAISLPANQQTGWLVETPSEFLKACLGEQLARSHILGSSLDVIIIGKKSLLKDEICSEVFFCETSTAGCLQDILRVREFSGANASFRSRCLASLVEDNEEGIGDNGPQIIAFDGAIAYLRHSHRWPTAHQVVFLDRTERQFADAVELLNQNYAYRSSSGFELQIKIPRNIEMMIYAERK